MVRLTLEQKYFLKFMSLYLNYDPKEIQNHQSMLKPDGSAHRLSTIKFWINRSQSNELELKKKPGRPTIIDKDQISNLVNMVEESPKSRYNQIRMQYLRKYNINIRRRTINNYMLRNKYNVTKAVKRPSLSKRHQKDRLKLANKHLENSTNIIFSDEKKFILNNNDKSQYVTRPENSNPFENKYMHYGRQLGSNADINIWMYIGPFGKGTFII